ncbi:MAG: aminoacyl-tRNA hydrolase [Thermoanaerobaculia bacterium]
MKLIVGLGNPGGRYERTRHNVGFMVAEAFASKFRIAIDRHERDAYVGKGQIAGRTVMVARPQTFMNLSGNAVSKLVSAHIDSLDDLIVVYDDIDLPVGRLRIRQGGSAGTHNGMKSIVESLGSEKFPRVRFGVRGEDYAAARDLADYVLDDFAPEDAPKVESAITRAVDALAVIVRGDLARAMNQFNKDPVEEEPKP